MPDSPRPRISAVAFDLDDTLAESKSPIEPEMAALLLRLTRLVPVCVISGGRFEQFRDQLLARLPVAAGQYDAARACAPAPGGSAATEYDAALAALHLMPTCGTRYYRYRDGDWAQVHAHDLARADKDAAIAAIERIAVEEGLWEPDDVVAGDRIEDRGSQITYSALGQRAAVADKKQWDPDGAKRARLQRRIQAELPELEVRAGGSTSIDITAPGIDKAYGIRRFAEVIDVPIDEILFIGDRLEPGGNDYPVVGLGVQPRAVTGPADTASYLPELLRALAEGPNSM